MKRFVVDPADSWPLSIVDLERVEATCLKAAIAEGQREDIFAFSCGTHGDAPVEILVDRQRYRVTLASGESRAFWREFHLAAGAAPGPATVAEVHGIIRDFMQSVARLVDKHGYASLIGPGRVNERPERPGA